MFEREIISPEILNGWDDLETRFDDVCMNTACFKIGNLCDSFYIRDLLMYE